MSQTGSHVDGVAPLVGQSSSGDTPTAGGGPSGTAVVPVVVPTTDTTKEADAAIKEEEVSAALKKEEETAAIKKN